jgi:hypothetical protein
MVAVYTMEGDLPKRYVAEVATTLLGGVLAVKDSVGKMHSVPSQWCRKLKLRKRAWAYYADGDAACGVSSTKPDDPKGWVEMVEVRR